MSFYFVFIYFIFIFLYAMTPILFTYQAISLRNTWKRFLFLLKHKLDACKEMINYFVVFFFGRRCEKSQDLQST